MTETGSHPVYRITDLILEVKSIAELPEIT
jgi:hypothetical protein